MSQVLVRFLIAQFFLLAACSSTPESEKPLALPEIANPITIEVRWRDAVAASNEFAFQPAVLGNAIFVADSKAWVKRVDLSPGTSGAAKEIWRVRVTPGLSAGVSVSDALAVVGTIKGEVIALSGNDGKVLWRSFLSAEVISPVAIADGVVVVRSGDNRLFGLDASNGQRKWSYQRPVPSLSVRSTSAPLIADQLAFVGFPGGKVLAINFKTGAPVWEGTVSLPKGANELERITDVVASPVIGAKELCAVAHQGRLVCFDLTNGNLLWAKEVSSALGLAIDQSAVFVTDDKGVIHAFDRVTGGNLWKQEALVNRPVSAPFIRRGNVLVADGSGSVHALSRDDGSFRGRVAVGGGPLSAPMVAVEEGVLLQTRSGILAAIRVD
jgi:outer membrane protein assembly factor BamB